MELRTDTSQPGRWVLAPKKGTRFLGPRERARVRARERRRRIFVVLLESIALTALMGIFPPLRAMLYLTGALAVLLGAYLAMVVRMVGLRGETQPAGPAAASGPPLLIMRPQAVPQDRPVVGVAGR